MRNSYIEHLGGKELELLLVRQQSVGPINCRGSLISLPLVFFIRCDVVSVNIGQSSKDNNNVLATLSDLQCLILDCIPHPPIMDQNREYRNDLLIRNQDIYRPAIVVNSPGRAAIKRLPILSI